MCIRDRPRRLHALSERPLARLSPCAGLALEVRPTEQGLHAQGGRNCEHGLGRISMRIPEPALEVLVRAPKGNLGPCLPRSKVWPRPRVGLDELPEHPANCPLDDPERAWR
eukprot:12245935-Alexandrium_andersonii.AAC.2